MRWDVTFFYQVGWHWHKKYILPLRTAIVRKQIEVDATRDITTVPIIGKISFSGVVSVTEPEERKNYKGRLFWANAGDLIYSKIRVKQGSMAIVPEEIGQIAVSNEYPVYSVNTTIADTHYVALVLRTRPFLKLLDGLAHGGSTKTRIPPEDFERLEIPLPPLQTQHAIVARWQAAQAEVAAAEESVEQLELALLLDVRKSLGRVNNEPSKRPKAFVLSWKDLERWGVEIAWRAKTKSTASKYPMVALRTLCNLGTGGTPSRKIANYFGGEVPWVKTTEVRGSVILETEETLTQLGLNHSHAKIYPKGSLIVAMYGQGATRGRVAKLGIDATTNQACAVLTNFDVRVDADYVWVYLTSEYDDLRAMASGNNQPNLSINIIADYPISVPPLTVQREMVNRVQEGRVQIARERESAKRKAEEAKAEIEAMILGTRKITPKDS